MHGTSDLCKEEVTDGEIRKERSYLKNKIINYQIIFFPHRFICFKLSIYIFIIFFYSLLMFYWVLVDEYCHIDRWHPTKKVRNSYIGHGSLILYSNFFFFFFSAGGRWVSFYNYYSTSPGCIAIFCWIPYTLYCIS